MLFQSATAEALTKGRSSFGLFSSDRKIIAVEHPNLIPLPCIEEGSLSPQREVTPSKALDKKDASPLLFLAKKLDAVLPKKLPILPIEGMKPLLPTIWVLDKLSP